MEFDERVKRAVYENITRNFDIFEFLDENISRGKNDVTNAQGVNEGDDEMSDELEFEIDDDEANRMESYNFDTDHNRNRGRQTIGGTGPILDLNDEDSANGNNRTGDEPLRMLKRGST